MMPTIRLRFSPTTPKLRARVYPGIPPLQAEFRNNGLAIQWRVGASGVWTDLVLITDITSTDGNVVVKMTSGNVTIGVADGVLLLNKTAPEPTIVSLPSVAARVRLPLRYADIGGNAGDITFVPDGSDKIMGLSSMTAVSNGQGAGMAASGTLYPSTDINGWYLA